MLGINAVEVSPQNRSVSFSTPISVISYKMSASQRQGEGLLQDPNDKEFRLKSDLVVSCGVTVLISHVAARLVS